MDLGELVHEGRPQAISKHTTGVRKAVAFMCFCLLGGKSVYLILAPQSGPLYDWFGPFPFFIIAGFLLVAALYMLVPETWSSDKTRTYLLGMSSVLLLLLTLNSFINKDYQFPQFIEHAIQICLPFVYVAFFRPIQKSDLILPLKIIIALTFLGHGLYALGFPYGQPANFMEMTQNILGLGTSEAQTFLLIAGILDMVIVVGLFFPITEKYVLYYAVFWGFATAFARIVAYVEMTALGTSLLRWAPETLFRLGHGGVPLFFLWILATYRGYDSLNNLSKT